MIRFITNTYLMILLAPLLAFVGVVAVGVPPDPINLLARLYVFAGFAYVGARYVGRAPILMWRGDTSPEARNIVGWGIIIMASMMQQLYAWLYIVYERPVFLSSSYWSPSFVVLAGVGLTLVASSVPRFPPFGSGPNGLSVISSFCVGLGAALGLFLLAHVAQAWAVLKALLLSLVAVAA